MMTKPQIKLDWTINVGQIGALLIFVVSAITGWYNLKEDVAVTKAKTEVKFMQIDSSLGEVKETIVRNTSEIKSDIKDLRSEVLQAKR